MRRPEFDEALIIGLVAGIGIVSFLIAWLVPWLLGTHGLIQYP